MSDEVTIMYQRGAPKPDTSSLCEPVFISGTRSVLDLDAAMAEARRDFARANLRLCDALAALPDDHPACAALQAASFALFTGDQRLATFVSWPPPDLSDAAALASATGQLGEIACGIAAPSTLGEGAAHA